MGMYDYITVTCPNCKGQIDGQTKAGPCCFYEFNLNLPLSISEAEIVIGDEIECNHCGKTYEIIGDLPTYKLKVNLKEINNEI